MENTQQSEPLFRLNITQNTKGHQWEVTIRGNTTEEIKERMDAVVAIAKVKCEELNGAVQ